MVVSEGERKYMGKLLFICKYTGKKNLERENLINFLIFLEMVVSGGERKSKDKGIKNII